MLCGIKHLDHLPEKKEHDRLCRRRFAAQPPSVNQSTSSCLCFVHRCRCAALCCAVLRSPCSRPPLGALAHQRSYRRTYVAGTGSHQQVQRTLRKSMSCARTGSSSSQMCGTSGTDVGSSWNCISIAYENKTTSTAAKAITTKKAHPHAQGVRNDNNTR